MSKKKKKDENWTFSRRDLNRRGPDGHRIFLTLEDTAAWFEISKSTVLDWVKQGVVPYHELDGRIYFNREEVAAYWTLFGGRK